MAQLSDIINSIPKGSDWLPAAQDFVAARDAVLYQGTLHGGGKQAAGLPRGGGE